MDGRTDFLLHAHRDSFLNIFVRGSATRLTGKEMISFYKELYWMVFSAVNFTQKCFLGPKSYPIFYARRTEIMDEFQ